MALPDPSPGSTCLVTGASSGIGVEIARILAASGHGVTLVARRRERLDALARELSEAHGVRAEAVACDLGDPSAREALVAQVEELGLTVEVLVNNAGFGATGDFAELDRERQVEMVRLNVEAVVDLAGRYVPPMTERGRGALINIASAAAFQPLPANAVYAATKSFVLSFSEALHSEVRSSGVSVTAVCPGPVKTEFVAAAGFADGTMDRLPGFMWSTAEGVAREAVEAAAKGRRVVVPGLVNKAAAVAGQHAPRAMLLPVMGKVWNRFN